MLAALLSLAIFAYCTVLGLGVIAALSTEQKPYLPLLAPIIGAATAIVPAVWLSEAGVPMARGGPILLAALLAGAIVAVVRTRRRIQVVSYWPFALILLAGFGMAAWPLFQFGFNWLSYGNDDMANYVLNAERLLELGWFTVPDYSVYNFNKDPTAIYWMNWTVDNERYGAEMLVTLTLSVFRLNGFQVFMPVCAALGLMQIAAAAAIIYRNDKYRTAAILTAALLAIASLAIFGIEYQLLAQLFGLPLLIASVVLLCDVPSKPRMRSVLLCSVATAGLAMVYPEISPFAYLSVAVYFAIRTFGRSLHWRVPALWLGSVGMTTLVLVNIYMRNYLTVMESRVAQSAAGENTHYFIVTFPFYLIPSGIPNLFGILSAVQGLSDPWLSLGILFGIALLVIAFVAAVRAAQSEDPAGPVVLVMFALGILLFAKQNGFGLFKSAMYVQPFLIGCLVLWWLNVKQRLKWPSVAVVLLFVYAGLNVLTGVFYVDRSRALWSKSGATFVEIPNASASHLLDEFSGLVPTAHRTGTTFLSDSSNVVFAKIESFYARPANIIFPSDNFLPGTYMVPPDPIIQRLLIPSLVAKAIEMSATRGQHFRSPDYLFTDDYGRLAFNGFFADTDVPRLERNPRNVFLLEDTAAQSVVNRWYQMDTSKNFRIIPLSSVRNHLIFVAARYGLAYYSHSKTSSLFQLEPDLFYPGRTMAGMGRRFLFAVVNSSKKIRLEVDYTATLKDDGESILHSPFVTGATLEKRFAPVVGRGSARLFLPATAPRIMVGQPFIMLDMNVNGTLFPSRRTGLMRLYGTKIPLDGRLLVGFVRDISAISEDDYRRIRPPSFLSNLPKDLTDRTLEYSGAYEDGWVSETSQYVLTRPREASVISIRGLVPLIEGTEYHSLMRVRVDGREIGRANVGVGTFDFTFPAGNAAARPRVELLFDRFQRLPNGDGRPVALKLYSFGFQTAGSAARARKSALLGSRERSDWFNAIRKGHIDFGTGWYPLETFGGQTFRWANNDARIVALSRTNERSRLQIDVAPGPGEGGREGRLHLLDSAGRELGVVTRAQRQIATFRLRAAPPLQTYVLHIEGGGASIPSDPRILDFRVFAASIK